MQATCGATSASMRLIVGWLVFVHCANSDAFAPGFLRNSTAN
jgi:hypothetical protein